MLTATALDPERHRVYRRWLYYQTVQGSNRAELSQPRHDLRHGGFIHNAAPSTTITAICLHFLKDLTHEPHCMQQSARLTAGPFVSELALDCAGRAMRHAHRNRSEQCLRPRLVV